VVLMLCWMWLSAICVVAVVLRRRGCGAAVVMVVKLWSCCDSGVVVVVLRWCFCRGAVIMVLFQCRFFVVLMLW